MLKLLTKGIGHSEFKKTEVGEIPVEWEVKSILSVSNTMSGGTPNRSKKHYYIDGNISWVKTGELGAKYIHDTEEKITELLEIPPERELAALIAVGWPDDDPQAPKRKAVTDLLE